MIGLFLELLVLVLSFSFDGKYTEEAIRQKLIKLGLIEQQQQKNQCCCSSPTLVLPAELPSVEEVLKDLVAAMNALKTPDLSKTEIMRLRTLIQTSSLYQKRIAEYIDYRGLEVELLEWREKYAELVKKSPDTKPK